MLVNNSNRFYWNLMKIWNIAIITPISNIVNNYTNLHVYNDFWYCLGQKQFCYTKYKILKMLYVVYDANIYRFHAKPNFIKRCENMRFSPKTAIFPIFSVALSSLLELSDWLKILFTCLSLVTSQNERVCVSEIKNYFHTM